MEKTPRNLKVFFLLFFVGVNFVIWYAVFYFESHQNFLVTFFDVGQGDSIFMEAPNGNQVLIDGGPGDRILSKLGRVMPFWDRSIDLLILTHPHADHLDGTLEVLKRYDIGMVIESGVNHTIPEYEEWRKLLQEKRVEVIIAAAGQRVNLSRLSHLDILTPFNGFLGASPKNVHDAMIISKLRYGSTTALLMGDAEKSLEYQLIFSGVDLKSDILKVGHHGSKTSTMEEFLKAVSPQIAVISVGRKNRYGHPYQEVLDRLRSFGTTVFRTDQDGDIKFVSRGYNLTKYRLGDN